jgi:hypothetical protein
MGKTRNVTKLWFQNMKIRKRVPERLTRGIQAFASQRNCMGMKWIIWLITGTWEGFFEDGNLTSGVLGYYTLSTG